MTRAGRAGAAAAAALVLALVTACSAFVGPATPRTPATVQAAWPGCAAVGDGGDDPYVERSGVGAVPVGFVATAAVLCEQSEREDAAGDTVGVDVERTATDVGPLTAYLAQADERPTSGPCTTDGWSPPTLYLLDAGGRYVAPAIPVGRCGKPLGWSDRDRQPLAWEALAYTDRVVGQGRVTESAEAKRTGCDMEWKDLVDDLATSSLRRAGGFGNDLPRDRALKVCVFAVPEAGRGSDGPGGGFVAGRKLDGQDRAAFDTALGAAPETTAPCTSVAARFATVAAVDAGPTLYVELDGCRRAVSDGETTPVVRAGDALVALLGG